MSILKIRELEYIFNSQDQVVGQKPALSLALCNVHSVTKRRNGQVIFNTKQGPSFYANRPVSMIFGEVIKQPEVATILAELPVYDEYTYNTAQGKKATAYDKRSAASFVPVGKF